MIRKIFNKIFKVIFQSEIEKLIDKKVSWFDWAAHYKVKNQIEGDYVEFGVKKGKSFVKIYNSLKIAHENFYNNGIKNLNLSNKFQEMKFHAFDSFEGLPNVSETKRVQYFEGNYKATKETFINTLKKNNIDLEKVRITKGWFRDTCNSETARRIGLKKISIAFVDCDLYTSTYEALKFTTSFLQVGSVLVLDDYFRNAGVKSNGVEGAFLKWAEDEKIKFSEFYNSDYKTKLFIINSIGLN